VSSRRQVSSWWQCSCQQHLGRVGWELAQQQQQQQQQQQLMAAWLQAPLWRRGYWQQWKMINLQLP
jgi:hypothetical protein